MQAPPLHPAPGRFLHLVHDEKFIDAARAIFEEAAPGAHDFLVIGAPAPLRHIRSFVPARMELRAAMQRAFLSRLSAYSVVFVHYLGEAARLVVAAAPRRARFVWLAWGADYYHLLHPGDALLLPVTRVLAARLAPARAPPVSMARAAWQHAHGLARAALHPLEALARARARRTLRRIGHHAPGELRLLNRFEAVAMPIEEDHAALRARHPQLKIPFVDWNYWTEGFRADGAGARPAGDNILLGNSATATNNHLEVLERLATVLPQDRTVICPLSYGDRAYGLAVEAAGRRLLGHRFVPLREFMDPPAYAQVIASCSIVVMNHLRQQALGNIVLALCAGAHVFLNAASPVHRAMRRIGVELHDVEELPAFLASGERPVDPAVLEQVRHRIEEQYGRPSILRRTRALLAHFAPDLHGRGSSALLSSGAS